MRRNRYSAVAAGLAAFAVAVAPAGGAGITEGKTKLVPDPDTFEALADMSIAVEPTGQATFTNDGALRFPVKGGDFDSTAGGLIVHSGGVVFARDDGAQVKFSKLSIVVTENKAKVFAAANGGEMRIMGLRDGERSATDTSFALKDAEARLSKPAAELMSEEFDFPFRRGIVLGETTTKVTLTEGQVQERASR